MLIRALPWDSGFFGLNIGAVQAGKFETSAFLLERSAFDLVYIFEDPGSPKIPEIESFCGTPVDIRRTYRKSLPGSTTLHPAIAEYTGAEPNAELLALALQSGIYSRFYTDSRFPAGAYERLYRTWLQHSVDQTRARVVLIYQTDDNPIAGFVSLEEKGAEIHIGLIAVDASCRGQGIGVALVQAAEYYAHRYKFLYLKVSTQAANAIACRLYEKCGFMLAETVQIYHYWRT